MIEKDKSKKKNNRVQHRMITVDFIVLCILISWIYLTFKVPTLIVEERYLINAYTLKAQSFLFNLYPIIIIIIFLSNIIILKIYKSKYWILVPLIVVFSYIVLTIIFYFVFLDIFSPPRETFNLV